jgi:hypothetical protein
MSVEAIMSGRDEAMFHLPPRSFTLIQGWILYLPVLYVESKIAGLAVYRSREIAG